MQKKVLIVGSVAILIAAIMLGVMMTGKSQAIAIERMIPSGAISYVRADDLKKTGDVLLKTPVMQAIESINFDRLLETKLINAQQKQSVDQIKQIARDEVLWANVHKFIGEEFVFAVYPFDFDLKELSSLDFVRDPAALSQVVNHILGNLLMVSKVSADVQWLETLTRSVSKFGAEITREEVLYKDKKIQKLTLGDFALQLAYYRHQDYLILGIGQERIEGVIDVLGKRDASLFDDENFKKIATNVDEEERSISGYTNLQYIFSMIDRQIQEYIDLMEKEGKALSVVMIQQIQHTLSKTKGLLGVSFNVFVSDITRAQLDVGFNPSLMDSDIKKAYTCNPTVNKTAQFTPENALGYYWMNCLDAPLIWKQIWAEMEKASTEETGPIANFKKMEASLGLNMEEDILPIFGDEVGGYLANIKTGGMFPLPEFLFFLKINNKEKMDALLSLLTAQPFIMLQTEEYAGSEINYVTSPLGSFLEPSYTYYDGYWFLSINRPTIKKTLDLAGKNEAALVNSPTLASVGVDLNEKKRSFYYVNVKEFLGKVDGLLEWSNQWFSSKDKQQAAFKSGSEKRINDVRVDIEAMKEASDQKKRELVSIENNMSVMTAAGQDTTSTQQSYDALEKEISQMEEAVIVETQRIVELEDGLRRFEEKSVKPERRAVLRDEVIKPFIKAFKSMEVFGADGTLSNGVLKSNFFMKTNFAN